MLASWCLLRNKNLNKSSTDSYQLMKNKSSQHSQFAICRYWVLVFRSAMPSQDLYWLASMATIFYKSII